MRHIGNQTAKEAYIEALQVLEATKKVYETARKHVEEARSNCDDAFMKRNGALKNNKDVADLFAEYCEASPFKGKPNAKFMQFLIEDSSGYNDAALHEAVLRGLHHTIDGREADLGQCEDKLASAEKTLLNANEKLGDIEKSLDTAQHNFTKAEGALEEQMTQGEQTPSRNKP